LTIQINGISMKAEIPIRKAYRNTFSTKCRMRIDSGTGGLPICKLLAIVVIVLPSGYASSFLSTAQVAHLEQREHKNKCKVHVGHCGSIAEPEVNECLIEDVHDRRDRGVDGAAAVGQDRDLGEQAETT